MRVVSIVAPHHDQGGKCVAKARGRVVLWESRPGVTASATQRSGCGRGDGSEATSMRAEGGLAQGRWHRGGGVGDPNQKRTCGVCLGPAPSVGWNLPRSQPGVQTTVSGHSGWQCPMLAALIQSPTVSAPPPRDNQRGARRVRQVKFEPAA